MKKYGLKKAIIFVLMIALLAGIFSACDIKSFINNTHAQTNTSDANNANNAGSEDPEPQSDPQQEPNSQPEPHPETDPESKPDPQPEADPELKPDPQPDPEPQPDQKDQAQILLESLTLDEKIGQMFLIIPDQLMQSVPPDLQHDLYYGFSEFNEEMQESLEKYPVGGFALFHKHVLYPEQLINYTDKMYENSKIVPIIVTDEEGGPYVARIARTVSFQEPSVPSMGEIGLTEDTDQAKDAGSIIGGYLRKYGINANFGPVADLDSIDSDGVIADRSFGTDTELVSKMVGAYIDGLHENNVLSCLKHFPGQGSATTDTHAGFSSLQLTMEELIGYDVIPFKENIEKTDMIMLSHLSYPNITGSELPVPFCKEIVSDLLKDTLGFEGIIITDAFDMRAINDYYTSEEAAIKAINAGVDMILMPKDFSAAFEGVKSAVENGEITIERIDESVLRILRIKEKISR